MNFTRSLKALPLWCLVPAWFFGIGSFILGALLFAQAKGAGTAEAGGLYQHTLGLWLWGECALFFSAFLSGALMRLRISQQYSRLAMQASRIAYTSPETFEEEACAEDRPVVDAFARAAQYVQQRLSASASREQQARRLFDSNITGMAVWRRDGLILDANEAFLKLIGYSPVDVRNGELNWKKLTPEEFHPLDARALDEIRTHGGSVPYEKEYIHFGGHRVPVLVAAASTDNHGEEGICIAIDQTQAKRTHLSLKRRIELEHLLASFSAKLITLPCEQLAGSIRQALAEYGAISGIDATAIYLFDATGQQLLKEYEWRSEKNEFGGIVRPSSAVLHSMERLRAGEVVQSFPVSGDSSTGIDPAISLQSEVNVPLIYGGNLAGVLTIQSTRDDRHLSTEDLTHFRLLGQMMANGLARLRIDAALRESRETKRAVWESSLDGIITMDSAGCIRDWNPAAEKIFGYSREEVIGASLAERIVPESLRRQHEAGLRRYLSGGTSRVIGTRSEIVALRKDRTEFPCELSITPVKWGEHDLLFIGTVRDITERRQNEEKLQASQAALRRAAEETREVLDALPVQVALFDGAGAIVMTNQVWKSEGGPDWMLPGDARASDRPSPVYQRILDVAAGTSDRFTLEYSDSRTVGKRWFRVMAAPLAERAHGAVVMHMDITDHQLAVEALADSEERYRSLVDNAREAIFSLCPNGTIRSLNPAFATITGHSREDWIGRTISDFLHSGDVEKATNLFTRVLAGETQAPFTLRAMHAEGRILEFECTAVPQHLDGRVVGLLGVARDVTERNRLEEQLRQTERMDSIGQLAAGVAHDFNNILTIQQSYASELAELTELPDAAREAIAEITAAGERAAVLTRKLLAFGRKQAMQPKLIDCNDFLRGMRRSIERILGEDIAYTLNAAAALQPVYIDASMLEQVVTILVSNSHDAMPDGGALVISTECVEIGEYAAKRNPEARTGPHVRLTVTDTGSGISEESLQHIFEPFFTTKDVARGSGLGLATAHGIIKQHNGWIEVDSRPNAGATFRIYLPAIQTPPLAATPPISHSTHLPRSSAQETILVVEDEAQLCSVVGHFLKRRGYHVLTAQSGIEALKLWDEHEGRIDLLLTDLVMPEGMTGKELADRLLSQRPNLKVIYTSGYSSEVAGRDLSLQAGFNFLPKPYQPAVLEKVVRECLDKA